MSRISKAFKKDHPALIAYVTAGYPDLASSMELIPRLEEWGCDIVELGIPFSDPLADGVTIQETTFKALQLGITTRHCLDLAARLREKMTIPLLFMTYYNILLRYGLVDFCRSSGEAGIDGIIVADMPPDEAGKLEKEARKNGIDIIFLLSPNSSDKRIRLVAKHSTGFIYLVSVTGVTGAREALPQDLEAFVKKVRSFTTKPLCVGFGISNEVQAAQVGQIADGVIVGSRLLQLIDAPPFARLEAFVRGLRAALDKIKK